MGTLPPYNHGMVFGVFDKLHPGHQHFLRTAAAECRTLIVVVTPDETVLALKQRQPHFSLMERIQHVQDLEKAWVVIPGDTALGSWRVLEKYRPDAIFLGYDQHDLREALREKEIPLILLSSHEPHRFKSSLL